MVTRKSAIAAIAGALALGGATLASTSPAQAWCGYYGCGYGYSDGAIAAGIIGGLAVGAIAASAAHQAHEAEARRAYHNSQPRPARRARAVKQARR